MTDKLTNKDYWDSTYQNRVNIQPVSILGFMNRCNREIYQKKIDSIERATNILEIGGGGSAWIAFLAKEFPEKKFTVLDYSSSGCDSLRQYANHNDLSNIQVIQGDFFKSEEIWGCFDLVYSHGVVEHFSDLAPVLRANSNFIAPNGHMFTLIPNMSGSLGFFAKHLDKEIYNIHNPHDLPSLKQGHIEAELRIVAAGYLCSINFGVLSSCIKSNLKIRRALYKLLSGVSLAIWFFENIFFRLPTSQFFSPYIYVLSERHQKMDQRL